jgi:hypothetical protein
MADLRRITQQEHAQLLLLHGHVVFDPKAQFVKPLVGPLMHWQYWDLHTPTTINDRQAVLATLRRPKCLVMVDDGTPELADQLRELRKNDPYIGLILIERKEEKPLEAVAQAAQETGTVTVPADHWNDKRRSSLKLMQALHNARELAVDAGLPREEPLKPVPDASQPEVAVRASRLPATISRSSGQDRIRPGADWHRKG